MKVELIQGLLHATITLEFKGKRKRIEAGEIFTYIPMDFGYFYPELEINGLIGLDILLQGRFYIDLNNLTITSNSGK